jgi:ankyrin repeat protein
MSFKRAFNRIFSSPSINAPGADGETHLTRAIRTGDAAIVSSVLDAGAAVDAKNARGEYPAHLAFDLGYFGILDMLIVENASVLVEQGGLTLREKAEDSKMDALASRLWNAEYLQLNIAAGGYDIMPMSPGLIPSGRRRNRKPE